MVEPSGGFMCWLISRLQSIVLARTILSPALGGKPGILELEVGKQSVLSRLATMAKNSANITKAQATLGVQPRLANTGDAGGQD